MYRLENNIVKTNDIPLDEIRAHGVGYFCFQLMKKYEKKLAQIDISTGEEDTYGSILKKCVRTSIVLKKMGVKKNDIVTICSDTNVNACIPIIACFFIGALPSYLDISFPLFELNHFLNSINPDIFLVEESFLKTFQFMVKDKVHKAEIVVLNDDIFKQQQEEEQFKPIQVNQLQETVIIHFSSGSTGFPKAVRVNHFSLLCNADKMEFDHVVLSYDSLHWGLEVLHLLNNFFVGGCRLLASGKDDWKDMWHIIDKYEVNVLCLPPKDIIYLLDCGKPEDVDAKSLSLIYVEGSSLPNKYWQSLQKLLPGVDVFPLYGQTELGLVTIFRKIRSHKEYSKTKPSCMGTPVIDTGMSLKVVDMETREILGPSKHGELLVKSKCAMDGYCHMDSSDQFEDGWLKTGDIVYYDEDFCFFFVSRIKDVILFEGWHVVPALLESELLSHPAVKYAAVIGVPGDKDVEHPLGLIALHEGSDTISAAEIEKYVQRRVPSKYLLRGGVKIISESYLSTGKKIKRFKLRELVISGKI